VADESFEERTEKPTPRKREEVRQKGEVAKTRELPATAVLLSGAVALAATGSFTYREMSKLTTQILSLSIIRGEGAGDLLLLLEDCVRAFLLALSPVLAVVFVTAVLSNVAQVGFVLSLEELKPKFSKINPLKGLERLFSKQSLMELFKSLLKLVIIGIVAYGSVKEEMGGLVGLGDMELSSVALHSLSSLFKIFLKCGLAMMVLVALDYAFQRWEFEKRIRMTRQEIKEELKKSEGDPLIKARVKSIQREMARRRMMQSVAKADVVITNPTHLAVALSYQSREMNAPLLVAKGAERIAEKIREVARKHGVPIVENKKLAQSLYTMVDLGHEIPGTLYQAVAEILAYVYRLKGRLHQSKE
jgi:flagellar biosynthetic protein FlhB